MEKSTLTSAVVVASLIGTPCLAEDKSAQPQLKPSVNAVEFCKELSVAPLDIHTAEIDDIEHSTTKEQCGFFKASIDEKIKRKIGISVAGIRANIECVYERHIWGPHISIASDNDTTKVTYGAQYIYVDDLSTPSEVDFWDGRHSCLDIHSVPYVSTSCAGTSGFLDLAYGPTDKDRTRKSRQEWFELTITPEDQKRYDDIMRTAREALRKAISNSSR